MALDKIACSTAALRYFATLDPAARRGQGRRHVVAAITPWNFPVLLLIIKVGPSPACRKHSRGETGPDHAAPTLRFRELCARIVPAALVNVFVGQNDLGPALTTQATIINMVKLSASPGRLRR